MMNGFEYTGMDAILAGSFRAAIYCRLSKDDDLDGESAQGVASMRSRRGAVSSRIILPSLQPQAGADRRIVSAAVAAAGWSNSRGSSLSRGVAPY